MIAASITALECTKFDFGLCSTRTPLGELTALPQTPSWFKEPTSKGGKGTGKEGERERERGRGVTGNRGNRREGVGMPGKGKGKGGEGRKKKSRGETSKNIPSVNSCLRPWHTVHSETTTSASVLAVAVLHQVAPGQMTWLEDPPPSFKPWLRPT